MMIVDSHCHLNFPQFENQIDDVIARAHAADVMVQQTICTKMSEFEDVYAIAEHRENLYCSVGVHPHEADKAPIVSAEELIEKASRSKVIGIGETGLDYFYEHSPRKEQKISFINHIEAARETGLPMIVHTRDADEDTVDILQSETKKGAFPFLIHCFSSTDWLAQESIKLGGYISISGIVTFKKAEELREAVRNVPLERLLVETDAPYLAPMPHRGKTNEPAYTRLTCEAVADLKGVSLEDCAAQTTENFFTLFTKAQKIV